MILVKTSYKTHNNKILAIVKAFKTWQNYLEDCKYKVFIPTNHNNFCHLIYMKSLSFYQIW